MEFDEEVSAIEAECVADKDWPKLCRLFVIAGFKASILDSAANVLGSCDSEDSRALAAWIRSGKNDIRAFTEGNPKWKVGSRQDDLNARTSIYVLRGIAPLTDLEDIGNLQRQDPIRYVDEVAEYFAVIDENLKQLDPHLFALVYNSIALGKCATGRLGEAKILAKLASETLEVNKYRNSCLKSVLMSRIYGNRASFEISDTKAAVLLCGRAVKALRHFANTGDKNVEMARSGAMSLMGRLLLDKRDFRKAVSILAECLASTRSIAPKSILHANVTAQYGFALLGIGDGPAADAMLLTSFEILEEWERSSPGIGKSLIPTILEHFGTSRFNGFLFQEAATFYERILDYCGAFVVDDPGRFRPIVARARTALAQCQINEFMGDEARRTAILALAEFTEMREDGIIFNLEDHVDVLLVWILSADWTCELRLCLEYAEQGLRLSEQLCDNGRATDFQRAAKVGTLYGNLLVKAHYFSRAKEVLNESFSNAKRAKRGRSLSQIEIDDLLAAILYAKGSACLLNGEALEAENYAKRAIQVYTHLCATCGVYAVDKLIGAKLLLAQALNFSGRLGDAESVLYRVLEDSRHLSGPSVVNVDGAGLGTQSGSREQFFAGTRCSVLRMLSDLSKTTGNASRAAQLLIEANEQLESVKKDSEWFEDWIECQLELSNLFMYAGRHGEAQETLQSLWTKCGGLDGTDLRHSALLRLVAMTALRLGKHDEALELGRKAFDILDNTGEVEKRVYMQELLGTLQLLGMVLVHSGMVCEALAVLEKGRKFLHSFGSPAGIFDRLSVAGFYLFEAKTWLQFNRSERVSECLIEALNIYDSIDDVLIFNHEYDRAATRQYAGCHLLNQGNYKGAAVALEAAMCDYQRFSIRHPTLDVSGELVDSMVELGKAYGSLGRYRKAFRTIERAKKRIEERGGDVVGDAFRFAAIESALAWCNHRRGNFETRNSKILECFGLFDEFFSSESLIQMREWLELLRSICFLVIAESNGEECQSEARRLLLKGVAKYERNREFLGNIDREPIQQTAQLCYDLVARVCLSTADITTEKHECSQLWRQALLAVEGRSGRRLIEEMKAVDEETPNSLSDDRASAFQQRKRRWAILRSHLLISKTCTAKIVGSSSVSDLQGSSMMMPNQRVKLFEDAYSAYRDYCAARDQLARTAHQAKPVSIEGSALEVLAALPDGRVYCSIATVGDKLVGFLAGGSKMDVFALSSAEVDSLVKEMSAWTKYYPGNQIFCDLDDPIELEEVRGNFETECFVEKDYPVVRYLLVDRILRWMSPGASQVILSLDQSIAFFPLESITGSCGRRIGDFEVCRVPSIAVYDAVSQSNGMQSEKFVVVSDPRDDLKHSCLEGKLVWMGHKDVMRLSSFHATRSGILEKVRDCAVFHYSGHARFDFADPASSALLTALPGELQLRDLFGKLRLSGCKLAVLNGCETGMMQGTIFSSDNYGRVDDEFSGLLREHLSLSTGFLVSGARCVVGSLWPVNDLSSTLLIWKFSEIVGTGDCSIVAGLRISVTWLRDEIATGEHLLCEIRNTFRGRIDDAGYESLEAEGIQWARKFPDSPPFASSIHWAGYIVTGFGWNRL